MSIKDELGKETQEEEKQDDEMHEEAIEVRAENDEVVEPPVRENVKDYLGQVLVVEWVNTEPVVGDNGPMTISRIDGVILSKDDSRKVLEIYKKEGRVNDEIKRIIKEHGMAVKLYSTSRGVYNSLMRGVVPQLSKGKVIVYIHEKKSNYPMPMVLLDPLKIAVQEM